MSRGLQESKTKERILSVAQEVFLENGYEATSVRMILAKAEVVTGSFYHFFQSKEELFEAVVERFLTSHQESIMEIAESSTLTILQKIHQILQVTEQNTQYYYQNLQAGKMHWTIQYALHQKTMLAILPAIEKMMEQGITEGSIANPLHLDSRTLAAVTLQGLEGILHSNPMTELSPMQVEKMKENAISYITMLLEPIS